MILLGFPLHALSPSNSYSKVITPSFVSLSVISVFLMGRVFTASIVADSIGVSGLRSMDLKEIPGIFKAELVDMSMEKPHYSM